MVSLSCLHHECKSSILFFSILKKNIRCIPVFVYKLKKVSEYVIKIW